MIVEDEPLILMSTVDMVEELGHTVHEASSAEDALVVLENYTVDFLLTDVGLPGMSGIDLARRVREHWPNVRIAFASGDDSARAASGIADARPTLLSGVDLRPRGCSTSISSELLETSET